MTTMVEARDIADYGAQLRAMAVGCRLSKSRWGIKKAVDEEQRSKIAELFEAEEDVVSAAKKLIDTANPRYKAVTTVLSQVTRYWREHTKLGSPKL